MLRVAAGVVTVVGVLRLAVGVVGVVVWHGEVVGAVGAVGASQSPTPVRVMLRRFVFNNCPAQLGKRSERIPDLCLVITAQGE
jgi:hypothetical protein